MISRKNTSLMNSEADDALSKAVLETLAREAASFAFYFPSPTPLAV